MAESRGITTKQKIGFVISALILSGMVALAHFIQRKLMAYVMAPDLGGADSCNPLGHAIVDMSMPVIYVTAAILMFCHFWLIWKRFPKLRSWSEWRRSFSGLTFKQVVFFITGIFICHYVMLKYFHSSRSLVGILKYEMSYEPYLVVAIILGLVWLAHKRTSQILGWFNYVISLPIYVIIRFFRGRGIVIFLLILSLIIFGITQFGLVGLYLNPQSLRS